MKKEIRYITKSVTGSKCSPKICSSSDKKTTLNWECVGRESLGSLTFHLLDAAQRVLERVDGAWLALVPLLHRKVHLQLLQGLEKLLLCLGFGGLLTAAGRT